MTAKILYDIQNVEHRYAGGPVTVNIEALRIKEGSVTGLVGPNGSGKSTLLKILALLEPPVSGKIFFDGVDTAGCEAELRRKVTYLLQDSYLLKRSVRDNIAYGLKIRGETSGMEERINDSLRRVGLAPEDFAGRPWFRLSGGEVQRAALAARLVLRPRVLLLDEPTANVDEASALLLKEAALSSWKEWGTTVITATHDLIWLHEISSDIVSLYNGRVIGFGAENIIHGEWCVNGGYVMRFLPDGQIIKGPRHVVRNIAAAVLSPAKIKISAAEVNRDSNSNALKGAVAQMTLERGTGNVLVSVDVCGLMLKAVMPLERARSEAIFPASRVTLSFAAADVRWLEKI